MSIGRIGVRGSGRLYELFRRREVPWLVIVCVADPENFDG